MPKHPYMTNEEHRFFERGSWIYPQPVAMSCGRIIRAHTPESLLDAILKSGEILARYLATVSLASFSARTDQDSSLAISSSLSGPMSFGTFLTIVQQAAKHQSLHPIRPYLQEGFPPKKTAGKEKTALAKNTNEALTSLLELRNGLGHDMASITIAKATSLLTKFKQLAILAVALKGVDSLLRLPLFVIEQQHLTRGKLVGQRLVLMGEAPDPSPDNIELATGLHWDGEPYVAVGSDALILYPMLVWRISEATGNVRLFVFDTIQERSVKYKAVEVSVYEGSIIESSDLHKILNGSFRSLESACLACGLSLCADWDNRRNALEQANEYLGGGIPWENLSEETLAWYASKLPHSHEGPSKAIIQSCLLDDRDHLDKSDLNQLVLLFGTSEAVHKLIGREVLDLRAVKTPGVRFDERVESHANLFECLRIAVEFFSRHIGIQGISLDGLNATSGSADYIAMREALVNLLIHQDYSDKSAAAQIEIDAEKAVCFNPGRSLVKQSSLAEGGKSQARNPLVARALRLIGFAELAGSGLRQLQNAWRTQNRRLPKIDTNPSANTFTLTLDWREIIDNYNSFWKTRLGVNLSPPEATILNLSADGVTAEEAASATGLAVDSAQAAIETLVRQALVEEKKGRFEIKDHLRALIQQRAPSE